MNRLLSLCALGALAAYPARPAHAEPERVYLTKNSVVQARPLRGDHVDPAPAASVAPASFHPPSVFEDVQRSLLYVGLISVEGNYRLSKPRILQIAGLEKNPPVWSVSAEEIRRRLLNVPWIEEATVRAKPYPATLSIAVREAEPWLIAEYERHSWLVSRKGVLLQPLDTLDNADLILETTELVRLDGLEPQPNADSYLSSANARFLQAVKLVKLLETAGEFPFPIERYTLLAGGGLKISAPPSDGPSAALPRKSYPQVLFSADNLDEAVMRVKRLNHVLEDLSRRTERARRIDLRFANQVIVE